MGAVVRRARRLTSVVEAIGNTPLVRLRRLGERAPSVEVYVKLEFANPGGSVKDRAGFRIISDALTSGHLGPGRALIDATSGNTGVAYAMVGAAMGVSIALVMPSNVTRARKDIAEAFGAQIIPSDPMEGTDGAIRLAQRLVAKSPDRYYYADQYSNPGNPLAHYDGTGVEILDALGDRITHFVAGLGTSGTMMGVARRLRRHATAIHCVAVQPAEALHGLEGMKHMPSSLVPAIYDPTVPDEHLSVATDDGWDMAERVAVEEGLYVGHSSGANIHAALQVAERLHRERGGGCVVTVACDRADRYFGQMRWEKKYVW